MSPDNAQQSIVLLVEEDDEIRSILKENLRRDGYRVVSATDEENALEIVSGDHLQPDLFVINLVGKTAEEALSAGHRIRQHGKYDGMTPLVVMAEKYGKDLEGTDVNVGRNDWIIYLGDEVDQLHNLLARLTS